MDHNIGSSAMMARKFAATVMNKQFALLKLCQKKTNYIAFSFFCEARAEKQKTEECSSAFLLM